MKQFGEDVVSAVRFGFLAGVTLTVAAAVLLLAWLAAISSGLTR